MRIDRWQLPLLAVVLMGCSGRANTDVGDASVEKTSALTLARTLAAPERDVADVLRGRIALQPVGDALVVAPTTSGDLAMRVAPHANEPTRIGTDDDHSVYLSLEDAAPSLVEADSGTAIHRDVYPGTDAIWATTEARAELAYLLRDASAPTTFRLHLERGKGLSRVEPDHGGITFRDPRGTVRLQIPTPIALDARGVRRAAEMRLSDDGATLQITLDDHGLERPILLDPAVLQGRWTLIGDRDKRTRGSLAFDPLRGKLIAYGGYYAGSYNEPGDPATRMYAYTFPARTFDALANGPGGFTSAMLGGSPPFADYGYFAAFDSARGKLVAVGSSQSDCTSGCSTNYKMMVSEWDSATNSWTARCEGTCAATAPAAAQGGIEVIYDVSRSYTVVCNTSSRACWTWNGATTTGTWTAITSFPAAWMGRGFYDTNYRGVTFLGSDGTYSWTGSAWTKRTTSTVSGAIATTFDSIRKRAIAIKGNGLNTDTYEWDGTTAAWALIVSASTSTPYNKASIAMGFDPINGRAVAWGGGNGQTSYYGFDFIGSVFEYQAFGNACAGDVDCSGGSCRDGYCCDTTCGSCRRCDGPGSGGTCAAFAGAATTGTEHDVCTGTKACDPAGVCKLKNGQTCASGNECISGACVDGVCCASACNQACEVCNATPGTCTPAAKGSSGRSSCGVGTCNGTLRTCSTTCTTDADCSSLGYCSAGTCVTTLGDGTACTRDRQCSKGACRDGVCCNSACEGPCNACATGTCAALPATTKPVACAGYACSGTSGACATSCTSDASCAAGYYCDGVFCQRARARGEGCARTEQCSSGLSCADGVCCNSACDGACQACSAANKQSGDAPHVCGPAKSGSDPGDRCPKDDASSCGRSGVCGATGTCALYAKGAACGSGVVCDAGSAKGRTCDGLGACVTDSAGTKCAPGTCSATDGCSFTCTTDSECDATGFCDSGNCRARAASGSTCTSNNQCASAYCVDGVCCSTACNAICEACNGSGTEGTCTASAGPPRAGHGSCPTASSDDACTAAACDGTTRDACKAFAGPEIACRAATCADATEQLATKCDGSGKCPAPSPRSCAPFACSGSRCAATCSRDEECTKGSHCDVATSKCVSTGTCDGDHTVVGADGSNTDCAPYKCGDTGCKNLCESSTECASPNLCSSGRCVAPVVAEDSGGCAMSSSRSSSGALLIALALAALRRRDSLKKGAR